ncbi:MAG: zinc ribbon domain-containing protein [Planctomycetaceae bacterium]|jgi:putative FmdB family regulatory protein|nr:zinc ribbon domain-containing protein [Planctomycetaceae bacterium]
MPIYEYRCQSCQAEFEVLVRGSEKPECPKCESKKLERRLSVVASPGSGGGDPQPMSGGMCGRPQCGMNGCQGLN